MIFKILLRLVAALFATATMVRAGPKKVHNPGCVCRTTTYTPKLISTIMNRAIVSGKKTDTNPNVGPSTPEAHPKRFPNSRGLVFELCTDVAAEHLYEYPLAKAWRPGKKTGRFFVIYDAQTSKFCGCFTREEGGKKCRLGTDQQGEGSRNPVPNPAVVPPG